MSTKNRKTAVRLLLINWSRFEHMDIHLEGSTLFTGVNGSGKSTILDAMTYLLTGNTQFNKAAKDRDRTVLGYVRGDTKSNGDSRFLRNAPIISYIVMEFDSPTDHSHLVIGVCIEVADGTGDKPYWFVCKNSSIDDLNFCQLTKEQMLVTPHNKLECHGKKIKNQEFLGRDKARVQILRNLGLRCDANTYRTKLLKMMAFNPENNIDKFIQDCVLEEVSIGSLKELREQKELFEKLRQMYLNLKACKEKLESLEGKAQEYEKRQRSYLMRDLMLPYQEIKAEEQKILDLEMQSETLRALLSAEEKKQKIQKEDLDTARERLEKANTNDLYVGITNSIHGLQGQIKDLGVKIKEYDETLNLLQDLQEHFGNELSWLVESMDNADQNREILTALAEPHFTAERKVEAYIAAKAAALEQKEYLNTESVHIKDRMDELDRDIQIQNERITRLNANILQFPDEIEAARKIIQAEFGKRGISTDVKIFAEYVETVVDEEWRAAIETFLGRKRYFFIIDGKYCKQAMRILQERNIYGATVVITDKLEDRGTKTGSAAEQLVIHNVYARRYADYLLSGIHLCADIDELHEYPKGGLMKDGMLAKSFAASKMNMNRTEMCLGQSAIRLQKKKAEKVREELMQERREVSDDSDFVEKKRNSLMLIHWDNEGPNFAAPKDKQVAVFKKAELESDVEKYIKDPGFAAVLTEQQKAQDLYKAALDKSDEIVRVITGYHDRLVANDEEQQKAEFAKKNSQREYDEKLLHHLELKRPMIEEYERMRRFSDGPRVTSQKAVNELAVKVRDAEKSLETEQLEYCKLAEIGLEKRGASFISFYRTQYSDLATVQIEKAHNQMEERGRELESAFMRDFIGELSEAIGNAQDEIDIINEELRQIPFGQDTYTFEMIPRTDRAMFFKIRDKLGEYADSAEFYLSSGRDDEEMEHSIQEFMSRILTEEDEAEYTDYRKYFTYDMKIRRRQGDEIVESDLSRKQGSASNGEKQTPYFIILAASLMHCYPKNKDCMRLAFIDEAFSALSRERIEQMVKYFEENYFQVIYAAPPEKISSIGQYITSTVSLFTSGNYTYAVDGREK